MFKTSRLPAVACRVLLAIMLIATLVPTVAVADAHEATVTGQVTDAATGLGIANATVNARQMRAGEYHYEAPAKTDSLGNFSITLPITISERWDIGFTATEYHDSSWRPVQLDAAAPVSVTETLTPVVTAIAGSISVSGTAEPVAGITVEAIAIDGDEYTLAAYLKTNAQGQYRFTDKHLKPGSYLIGISQDVADDDYFYWERWYGGAETASKKSAAVPVPWDFGSPTTGINLRVEREAPSVKVRIVDSAGKPVNLIAENLKPVLYQADVKEPPEAPAKLHDYDPDLEQGLVSYYFLPAAGGQYKFGVIGNAKYATQWYNNKASWETADVFSASPTQPRDLGTMVLRAPVIPDPDPSLKQVKRVSGSNRFSGSVKIAREAFGDWSGVDTVIIASGEDRAAADPLAAAGLAGAYNAPLFLVSSKAVPQEVSAAIAEISAKAPGKVRVLIVGGEVSVPDKRFAEISVACDGNVIKDRVLSSGGRYELSAKIAERIAAKTGGVPETVLIANGADPSKFFDALALSPIAAAKKYPLLLVSHDAIPDATAEAIARFKKQGGAKNVIIGGGPNTVSDRVRVQLGGERWSGTTRHATAIAIADKAVEKQWLSRTSVGAAAVLPDALTGGAAMGRLGGVLVLTEGHRLTPATGEWASRHRTKIEKAYVFGGPNSVSEGVITGLRSTLNAK